MSGRPAVDAIAWLKLLLAFDLVFVVACMFAYPFTWGTYWTWDARLTLTLFLSFIYVAHIV